jgi:hypothetical protein
MVVIVWQLKRHVNVKHLVYLSLLDHVLNHQLVIDAENISKNSSVNHC